MKKLNLKKLMAIISLLATTASVASLGAYAKPGDPTSDSSQQRMEEETQSTPQNPTGNTTEQNEIKVEQRQYQNGKKYFFCAIHGKRLRKTDDIKKIYSCPLRNGDQKNTPCGIENFNPKTDKYYKIMIDGSRELVDPRSTPNPVPTPNPTYGIENSWKSFPVFNKLSTTALVTNPNRNEANPVEFKLKDNDLNGFTKFYIKMPDTLKLSKKSAYELIHINDFSGFKQLMYESNPANNLKTPLNKFNGYAKRNKKKEETKPKKENSGFISNTCKKTREAVTNLCNSLKKVWPAKAPTQKADTNIVAPAQNTEANTAAPEQNTDPNRQTSSFNPFLFK